MASQPDTLALPVVPGFRIVRRVGRGGMGEVLHAVRMAPGGFRKTVALKQLALDHAIDRRMVQRFLQEARISAQLEHPNIVRIDDLLVIDQGHFIVMELLSGKNLSELVRWFRELPGGGLLPWWIPLSVAEQALSALEYAHERKGEDGKPLGLIHRDVTPRNLFVTRDGTVKLLDFGIAKLREELSPGLTTQGHLNATLEYVAPEHVRGKEADARTDLYQLGGTLYFALGGTAPHGSGTPAEILHRALQGTTVPVEELRPELPPAVAALVMRALAPDPDARWPDAAAMREAVTAALASAPARGASALAAIMSTVPPDPEASPPEGEGGENTTADQGSLEIGSVQSEVPRSSAGISRLVTTQHEKAGLVVAAPPEGTAGDAIARPAASRRGFVRVVGGAAAAGLAAGFLAGRKFGGGGAPPAPLPPLQWTRHTFRRGTVFGARFAKDGTIVYSAAWGEEPLQTWTTGSGPDARPLGPKGLRILAVSPENETAMLLDAALDFGFVVRGTLARGDLSGAPPRELLEDVQWADFGPKETGGGADGARPLAIVRWTEARTRLEYPSGRVLLAPEEGWLGDPRISPDGSRIAYLRHPAFFDDRGTVEVIDVKSGAVRALGGEWMSAQGLAWSPSGEEIWFTATRAGSSRALQAVDLEGRERVLVNAPAGLTIADVDGGGQVLLRREASEMHVAAAVREGLERDLSWYDATYVADISRSGDKLLLGDGGGDAMGTGYSVLLRDTRSGSPAVRLAEGNPRGLSPDGNWALVISGNWARLSVVPTGTSATGETRDVPLGGLKNVLGAAWFRDGSRILFNVVDGGERQRIFLQDVKIRDRDVTFGVQRALNNERLRIGLGNPLSPDGKWLAATATDDGKILLVSLTGGIPRDLEGARTGEEVVRWSDDGKSVYVARFQDVPMAVHRIDVATGVRTLWKELVPADPTGVSSIGTVVMTGDARSYAYTFSRQLSALYTTRP